MVVESERLSERILSAPHPSVKKPHPPEPESIPGGAAHPEHRRRVERGAAQHRQSVTVILTPKRGPFSPVIPRPREESRICPLTLLSVSPPFPIEQRNRTGGRDSTYPGGAESGIPSCVKGDGAVGSPRRVTCTP